MLCVESSNSDLSDAEIFGWKEIPFEPIGTESGKYPIVRPPDFDKIIQKAEDSRLDKKVACCLVKAPQGAGKTALSNEVKNFYKDKKDTFVILNSLKNIDPNDLAIQVIKYAISKKFIDEEFLKTINFDNSKKYLASDLTDFILKIFEKIIETNHLGIWIVDEFDAISRDEEKTNEAKSDFLQFLRSVIDKLASSTKLREKGFLFLMAHTEKSIEEFINVLQTLHGPATERFLGTGTIEIAYTIDILKQIIMERLQWARNDTSQKNLEPFDEKAIDSLFDTINEHLGSTGLTSFRMFEKSCYLAIKNAVKEKKQTIDEKLLLDAFETIKHLTPPTDPNAELSALTKNKINSILKSSLPVFNTSILEGILKGLKTWDTQTLTDISDVSTEFLLQIKNTEIYLGQLTFNVSTVNRKGKISLRILCVSKDKSSFDEKDLILINLAVEKIINDSPGFNLSVITIVLDNQVLPSFENNIKNSFSTVDDVLILNKKSSNNLIIIGCCTDNELDNKRGFFSQYVQKFFHSLLFSSFNDLTYVPPARCISLFQTLNICYLAGIATGEEELKTKTSQFTEGSKPGISDFTKLKELGLAQESTAKYVPKIPKSLTEFEQEFLKTADFEDLKSKIPNSNVYVETLENLKIFENNSFIDLEQTKKNISEDISNAQTVIENKPDTLGDAQLLKILVNAYNELDSEKISKLGKLVVISFIDSHLSRLIKKIERIGKPTKSQQTPKTEQRSEEKDTKHTDEKSTSSTSSSTTQISDEELLSSANEILDNGSLTIRELAQKMDSTNPKISQALIRFVMQGKLKISGIQ